MTTTEFIDWLQINDKVIVGKVQIYSLYITPFDINITKIMRKVANSIFQDH